LPAAVDHFLGTAFHLRVTTLHGVKVQFGAVGPHAHTGRSTTTHTNTHAGTAQLNQQGAHWQRIFVSQAIVNRTQTTGNHDGLVVAPALIASRLFKSTEVTQQVGTTKFVIEGSTTNRAFNHDVQRAGDTVRNTVGVFFPRFH